MADGATSDTRRGFLAASGVVAVISTSGCIAADNSENGGDDSDSETTPSMDELATVSDDDYPLVERWLGTDEVGGIDDTYNGTIIDARQLTNPEITVGAEGNGGPVAFDPSAVMISSGAVVKWTWTAHGHHDVVSDPDTQLGESAQTFSSGEIVEREGNLHTAVFDEPGIVLYQCEPHLDLGMKGALIIDSE